VYRDWIPLGVWRYREIARAALAKAPQTFTTFPEALAAMGTHVRLRLANWRKQSVVLPYMAGQRKIEDYAA